MKLSKIARLFRNYMTAGYLMGVKDPGGLVIEIEERDYTELQGIVDWLSSVIRHPSLQSALCKCCGGLIFCYTR